MLQLTGKGNKRILRVGLVDMVDIVLVRPFRIGVTN